MDTVQKSVKDLQGLYTEVVGKLGQLFLVIQIERVKHFVRSEPEESDFHFEKRRFMGILSDERFVFRGSQYGISTESFAEVSLNEELKVVPGPFWFPFLHGLHGPNTVTIGSETKTELEVITGDVGVLQYRPDGLGVKNNPWSTSLICVARVLRKKY